MSVASVDSLTSVCEIFSQKEGKGAPSYTFEVPKEEGPLEDSRVFDNAYVFDYTGKSSPILRRIDSARDSALELPAPLSPLPAEPAPEVEVSPPKDVSIITPQEKRKTSRKPGCRSSSLTLTAERLPKRTDSYKTKHKRSKWTAEEVNLATRALKEGMTATQILRAYFPGTDAVVLKSRLSRIRKKLGTAKHTQNWTDQEIAYLKEGLKSGERIRNIHKLYFRNRTIESVKARARDLRRQLGITNGMWKKQELDIVQNALVSKISARELHKDLLRDRSVSAIKQKMTLTRKKLKSTLGKRGAAGDLTHVKRARKEDE